MFLGLFLFFNIFLVTQNTFKETWTLSRMTHWLLVSDECQARCCPDVMGEDVFLFSAVYSVITIEWLKLHLQSVLSSFVVLVWGGADGECLCHVLCKASMSSSSGFYNAAALLLCLFLSFYLFLYFSTSSAEFETKPKLKWFLIPTLKMSKMNSKHQVTPTYVLQPSRIEYWECFKSHFLVFFSFTNVNNSTQASPA